MLKNAVVTGIVGMFLLQGGVPPATHVWRAAEIQEKGRALSKKLDSNRVASETIASVGNRTFMVAHREGSGLAELHEKQADVLFISSGEVTMVYGGTVIEGKTTAPGEIRGSGIEGGTEVNLGPGDVLHIPATIPHQMKLAAGAEVTYFVTKVVE
jgi:uncharacterized RmlC-like cupin family protein